MARDIAVDLIALAHPQAGGISRYGRELADRLSGRVDMQVVAFVELPLARRFTPLRGLPAGVAGRRPGSIVHFTQLMGDVLQAYRPVHPALATVHDLGRLVCPEDNEMGGPVDRLLFRLQLIGLRRMDRWVVNSDYTRRCLVDLLGIPDERITWVQLGVDSEHFRPVPNAVAARWERCGVPPAGPGVLDLLYVGNEQPRKGLVYLLEALARLRARGKRVRLVKAGDGGGPVFRAQFLADADRFGVRDLVHLVERVSDADLPVLYSAADLYVCPTLLEGGFNWPVMEALACGTPAVVTTAALALPSARAALTETPARSAAALADAIAMPYDDPGRRARMAAAARAAVLPYTWERTALDLLQVYEPDLSEPVMALWCCCGCTS